MKNKIIMFNIPEENDVLTIQYFTGLIEIRSKMTGLTGSGILIASLENPEYREDLKEEIVKLYEVLSSVSGVEK